MKGNCCSKKKSIDGIRWIKDLVAEFPKLRILVVSRQSEQTYAERTLRAGELSGGAVFHPKPGSKDKLGYANAEELRRGARDCLGHS